MRKRRSHTWLCGLILIAVAQIPILAADSPVEKTSSRTITSPTFDSTAEHRELFDGMQNGEFSVQVIPRGPELGYVLITNTTKEMLTVDLPETFVAVPVLKQFNGLFNGNGNANGNLNGNNGLAGGNQASGQQPVGGGFQQNNNGNGNAGNPFGNPGGNNNPGNGFFSIPPERTIRLSYVSACLAHGRPDPTPRSRYELVPTAEFTQDPVLQKLIAEVAHSRATSKALQAAVWHRTDDLSWNQLATKFSHTVLGQRPYFTSAELDDAKVFVEEAGGNVAPTTSTSIAQSR
ncbi:MAG: hypothetical protein R3C49_26555 [Planctomycetaceae bacterium]